MMSQPLCYFLIQNDEISGSSSISNDNFGAINNWKKLNGRDSLNIQALCPIFMLRLNAQVSFAGKNCSGSLFRLNTQAQRSGSILRLNILVFCAKKIAQAQCLSSMFRLNVPSLSGIL